ncbi:hypothetical protein B0T25DRAFT_334698 [Lasiosphaeria hispida]|uniref:Uncharacterized protein n=1 Tax=Lasiosphaeria hispida TaxID=260671 RepID=A0AAJ0H5U4_9PEZI|nr:hypothetical protein B0T25DRAFT_334698 [Lasiosphaeria hispida]
MLKNQPHVLSSMLAHSLVVVTVLFCGLIESSCCLVHRWLARLHRKCRQPCSVCPTPLAPSFTPVTHKKQRKSKEAQVAVHSLPYAIAIISFGSLPSGAGIWQHPTNPLKMLGVTPHPKRTPLQPTDHGNSACFFLARSDPCWAVDHGTSPGDSQRYCLERSSAHHVISRQYPVPLPPLYASNHVGC